MFGCVEESSYLCRNKTIKVSEDMTAMVLERETNNYWNLIKGAGNEVKLALIKRLTDDLMPAVASQTKRTKKVKAADFAGIWSDEEYMEPEEIIKIIKSERKFKNQITPL